MAVKKKSKIAKKSTKKVEKPIKKIDTKTVETVEKPKKCCKVCDCSKLKQIFTSQYFIIGLIVAIIIVLVLAFTLGKGTNSTTDGNIDIVKDKVVFTVYGDYMSPTLATFYNKEMPAFLDANPNIKFEFELYGGIEKAYYQDWGDSERAKKAEMCANEQGKESEMRTALLESAYKDYNSGMEFGPGIYTDDEINAMVTELGLDKTKFDACYTSTEKQQLVEGLLQSVYNMGFLDMAPVFTYNDDPFAYELLGSVAQNVTESKPIKPSITVKILGKTDLDYFKSSNVNSFKVFDFYYDVTSEVVDADSDAGKKLVSELGIEMLPAYVFEGQFKESPFYESVKEVLDNDNNILGLYKTATLLKVGVQGYYVFADVSVFGETLSQDYSMGDKDAKLTILEFSDYLCPYCQKFHEDTFNNLKADYIDTGKVKFYYLQKPISALHPTSPLASNGAMCAAEQGAYWQFHNAVFGTYSVFTDDSVKKVASDLNLDTTKFNDCYSKQGYDLEQQDIANYSDALGLEGTPGFIIGHVLVPGAMNYSVFKQVIEYELSKQ